MGERGVREARRTRPRRALDAALARLLSLPRGRADYRLSRGVRVPMRDGVELLTDVFEPVGEGRGTVLIRTPYGRTGPIADLTARVYAAHGFLVVNQSCRGTSGSGGRFEPFANERADGADAVAWLRTQPWYTGRFAVVGPSYLGFTAWAIMADPPPELATAVIAITAHDNHWVVHGSGAFSLEQMLTLLDGFGHYDNGMLGSTLHAATSARVLRRALDELPLIRAQETVFAGTSLPYAAWLTAPDPDDPVWATTRFGAALDRVEIPVLLQAGWQDRFAEQQFDAYARLSERGAPVALTVGDWTHVQTAAKGWGRLTLETLDWLDRHLGEGRSTTTDDRPVRVQLMGTPEWRSFPSWPPPTVGRVLHLGADGGLSAGSPPGGGVTRFTYDPADPTPAVGGRVVTPAMAGRCDNRVLEARADVRTFTSEPLTEPLEVYGRPVVHLEHGTDNPYADLFVRLCVVTPDGRSTNLSDGFVRLTQLAANGVVSIELETLAYRFEAGTRLRLQLSGGAHPRFARNLGTDEDPATGTTMLPSRRTIGHGPDASRLVLPCGR